MIIAQVEVEAMAALPFDQAQFIEVLPMCRHLECQQDRWCQQHWHSKCQCYETTRGLLLYGYDSR